MISLAMMLSNKAFKIPKFDFQGDNQTIFSCPSAPPLPLSGHLDVRGREDPRASIQLTPPPPILLLLQQSDDVTYDKEQRRAQNEFAFMKSSTTESAKHTRHTGIYL